VDRRVSLRLSAELAGEIRRQGERAYPGECCGILAGQAGEVKDVLRVVPLLNRRTDDPHRYLIGPEDLRRVEAEVRHDGLEVLGYYHSHPDHPAVPSAFDMEHAWPWYSYIIVQVNRGSAAELASWVLEDDRSSMQAESVSVLTEV